MVVLRGMHFGARGAKGGGSLGRASFLATYLRFDHLASFLAAATAAFVGLMNGWMIPGAHSRIESKSKSN